MNDSTPIESTLSFACAGETLVGILARPAQTPSALGLVMVVGGPQYRAGSHRQFVLLARALAAAGHAVLRFDCRGMGDSEGQLRDFCSFDDDIRAAIDALQAAQPAVQRVVLWGLCDAASASLLYQQRQRDERVAGLCLINPWVRSAQTLARTQVKHYYRQRLRQREFWVKLLSGGVAVRAAQDLLNNLRQARGGRPAARAAIAALPFQEAMAQACLHFEGPMLLLLSGDDYTAKEFLEYAANSADWTAALARPQLRRLDLPEADHTFSNAGARAQVLAAMLAWLSTADGWHTS